MVRICWILFLLKDLMQLNCSFFLFCFCQLKLTSKNTSMYEFHKVCCLSLNQYFISLSKDDMKIFYVSKSFYQHPTKPRHFCYIVENGTLHHTQAIIFYKSHFLKTQLKIALFIQQKRVFKWVFEKWVFSKTHLKTRFYYIFNWVFKSGICRKLWPKHLLLNSDM